MDEIKKINYDELKAIAAQHNFGTDLMLKDYYVTLVLYLLKDVQGIYFKGGTALQKIFLNYARLSEDADFTVTGDVSKIKEVIAQTLKDSKTFSTITYDKDVEGFIRIVAHFTNFSGREDTVFVDLNQRAKLIQKSERYEIIHFCDGYIPTFSVNTLARDEMFAEKMAATVGRNRPRDHYDVYTIIKAGLPINIELVKQKCIELVKQKCRQSGTEFDITRMFSRAKALKNRWETDMVPLLAKEVPFEEVMKTLAAHFKLKEVKEERRKSRSADK